MRGESITGVALWAAVARGSLLKSASKVLAISYISEPSTLKVIALVKTRATSAQNCATEAY